MTHPVARPSNIWSSDARIPVGPMLKGAAELEIAKNVLSKSRIGKALENLPSDIERLSEKIEGGMVPERGSLVNRYPERTDLDTLIQKTSQWAWLGKLLQMAGRGGGLLAKARLPGIGRLLSGAGARMVETSPLRRLLASRAARSSLQNLVMLPKGGVPLAPGMTKGMAPAIKSIAGSSGRVVVPRQVVPENIEQELVGKGALPPPPAAATPQAAAAAKAAKPSLTQAYGDLLQPGGWKRLMQSPGMKLQLGLGAAMNIPGLLKGETTPGEAAFGMLAPLPAFRAGMMPGLAASFLAPSIGSKLFGQNLPPTPQNVPSQQSPVVVNVAPPAAPASPRMPMFTPGVGAYG